MGGPKDDANVQLIDRANRLIDYLQRSVGYSLTGVIREQILQFMYGTGDNGKSTFSETLAALMGDYFQKAPQELLMRKARQQSNGPSPEIARLCGVRLVVAARKQWYPNPQTSAVFGSHWAPTDEPTSPHSPPMSPHY